MMVEIAVQINGNRVSGLPRDIPGRRTESGRRAVMTLEGK